MLDVCNQLPTFIRKPKSIKREVYAHKKRMRRISGLIALLVIIVVIAVISYFLITSFFASSSVNNDLVSGGSFKAALIDAKHTKQSAAK